MGAKEGVISTWKFDQAQSSKALAKMIIVDKLPFSFVEKEGFKNFMRVTMPQFHIPSRRTVTRDCYELYLEKDFQRSTSKSLSYNRYLDLNTKNKLHVFDSPLYR